VNGQGNSNVARDPRIPVGPVPTNYAMARGRNDQGAVVYAVTFSTPLGEQTYFFDEQAWERFLRNGRHVTRRVVVPASDEVLAVERSRSYGHES
jgi:hypothetical protein